QDDKGRKEGREPGEAGAKSVHAEFHVGAEAGDPVPLGVELQALAADADLPQDDAGDGEGGKGRQQGDEAAVAVAGEVRGKGAQQGDADGQGQEGLQVELHQAHLQRSTTSCMKTKRRATPMAMEAMYVVRRPSCQRRARAPDSSVRWAMPLT